MNFLISLSKEGLVYETRVVSMPAFSTQWYRFQWMSDRLPDVFREAYDALHGEKSVIYNGLSASDAEKFDRALMPDYSQALAFDKISQRDGATGHSKVKEVGIKYLAGKRNPNSFRQRMLRHTAVSVRSWDELR